MELILEELMGHAGDKHRLRALRENVPYTIGGQSSYPGEVLDTAL